MDRNNKRLVTDRDKRVFEFVFEQRAVLFQTLCERFFNSSTPSARNRLLKLEKDGYFKTKRISIGPHAFKVFEVTDKTVRDILKDYKFKITSRSWRSDSILHDIGLSKLRNLLDTFEMLENYYSESVLQSCSFFDSSDQFREYVALNSDACIRLKGKEKTLSMALEFEDSAKEDWRYDKKLTDYYLSRTVSAVLYFCSSAKIAKRIFEADESVCPQKSSKVYVLDLSKLPTEPRELVLMNRQSGRIRIGTAVMPPMR